MISATLDEFETVSSVIFLGSGFSRDAVNIRNNHLPVGDELKKALAEAID
jgi:hypothetical protein